MARNDVKGAKQFNYELPGDLVDEFREFARRRGNKVTVELALALRRHMAFPPSDELDPILDTEVKDKKKGEAKQ